MVDLIRKLERPFLAAILIYGLALVQCVIYYYAPQ